MTGAGSGIGRAVAVRLAAEGAAVAALDVAEDNLADTVAGHRRRRRDGGRLHVRRDLRGLGDRRWPPSSTDWDRPGWCATWPASVASTGPRRCPSTRWQQILAVNLTGPFLVCRATLPHLLEHGGSIVNVASNTALMGQSYSAAYCASKAGLLMFSKALAAEYLARGVRVNVVAPGGMDTPLIGTFDAARGRRLRRSSARSCRPMGFSTPAEIAASVAFLASDESSYTTGSVLSVDGGLTI